ncbi:MAG: cation:proton antiporter [Bacteroidales bacterium]|jgi:CPA2 family monovalent cation:H+ antiporter-2|nr:cation:proton antiporter [Bacteroidales bacterium]
MSHLAPLISDLALILITAGVTAILFKWLKQPVVLGYIVAGFLIGPHFFLLPSVVDPGNIAIWADIGIVFLLFALGLEFSFRKLIAVGGQASIATVINMSAMIAVGYLAGQLIGWTHIESIFLGGMLSMSSTTIIIKAFTDMGLQRKKFAGIVFGMLIVEDLAAILMMVLLSTIAVSKHFEGTELIVNVLRLVFFIVVWFVAGIFLIPILLKRFKKYLNDEILLIVSIGLCLGMVLFANAVGFSAALGAFIMGSILAETAESDQIEHLIKPLKNLFGAIFFVSVGMMLAPDIFVTHGGTILIFTVIVLVGRVIFATVGVLASGQGLRVSLRSGFSLAQIGEFSFIIATLGIQLGVISHFIYPLIVTVSIITTFTTPYLIRFANPAYMMLEKIIPPRWSKLLNGYRTAYGRDASETRQSDWDKVLKNVLLTMLIFTFLSLAVFFLSRQYLIPLITDNIRHNWGAVAAAALTLLLMSPFLAGLALPRKKIKTEYNRLWADNRFNKGLLVSLRIARIILCVALIMMVLVPLFPGATALLVPVSLLIMFVLVFFERFGKRPEMMEDLFLENLNEKERMEENSKAVNQQVTNLLLGKNVHIEEIEIPHNAPVVGKTLAELNFKQTAGVNIISIIRGVQRINVPNGAERIFPFDRIFVAGSDEEIQKFLQLTQEKILKPDADASDAAHQISLTQYAVEDDSPLTGRSIGELQIRERTGCIIIGVDREQQTISEFDADFVLQQGDVLWLAGENKFLEDFEKQWAIDPS